MKELQEKAFVVKFHNRSGRVIDQVETKAMISEVAIAKAVKMTSVDWSKVSAVPASNLHPVFENILKPYLGGLEHGKAV